MWRNVDLDSTKAQMGPNGKASDFFTGHMVMVMAHKTV